MTADESAMIRTANRLANVASWSIDVATGIATTSEEYARILGLESHDSSPLGERVALHPEPHQSFVATVLERCMTLGEAFDIQTVVLDATGAELDVRAAAEAVRNAAGEITHIRGAFYDVGAQTKLQRELAAQEALLKDTLDQIDTAVCFFDREWRLTFVNKTGRAFLPNSGHSTLGRSLWDLIPKLVGSEIGAAMVKSMDERVVTSVRTKSVQAEEVWLETTVFPTADGLAVYLRDVSEEEETRLRLSESTDRLRTHSALLDVARDAIFVRELDHTVSYWNHGAELLYGWSAKEMVGRKTRETLYGDPSAFDAAYAELVQRGHWVGELEQVTRDGRVIFAACRWQLARDEAGEPSFILCINTDVTEAKRDQEKRYRAQRMESLGTLASGVAHDLNNVLTPILMSSQLLSAGETDLTRLEMLQSIEAGVQRGADMIRQVLSFARGEEMNSVELDLGPILEKLESFCRDTLPKSVTVKIEMASVPMPFIGDSTQILQVLVNLVTNARDAMPSGGVITIRARIVDGTVAVEVEDTGCGMDLDTSLRVFEPFFTTKEIGRGTGLGLSTSSAIAMAHGGELEVYSEPGRGSRFQLRLPALLDAGQIPANTDAPGISNAQQGRGELVLVIDDEATIRQIVSQTLEANGYQTLVAGDGLAAIEILERDPSAIDLVFTDMMMPVMDGAATAAYLLENHPTIALIAASGLNANGGVARAAHSGVRHFLSKPFTTQELLNSVRDALDARTAPTK